MVGLVAAFLLACFVLFSLIFEIAEERDTRKRIAEDDEVARLDALWDLPAYRASSLPMRPATHRRSRNRLHRGF